MAKSNTNKGSASRNDERAAAYHPVVDRPRPLHADILESTKRRVADARDDITGQDGNELFIGSAVKLKGEISACDRLVVQGELEASMDVRHVDIAATGVLVGEIAADTARVAGRFEGVLAVRHHLDVLDGGIVSGTLRYRSFAIQEGGAIEGEVGEIVQDGDGRR